MAGDQPSHRGRDRDHRSRASARCSAAPSAQDSSSGAASRSIAIWLQIATGAPCGRARQLLRLLVGMPRFELGTSCTPSRRATRQHYIPSGSVNRRPLGSLLLRLGFGDWLSLRRRPGPPASTVAVPRPSTAGAGSISVPISAASIAGERGRRGPHRRAPWRCCFVHPLRAAAARRRASGLVKHELLDPQHQLDVRCDGRRAVHRRRGLPICGNSASHDRNTYG